MKTKTISIALPALICGVIAVTPPARAQDLTTLATFNSTDGADPVGDVTQIGTTLGGGANDDGPVFSVPVGGTPTTIATFNRTDGPPSEAA